MELSICSYSFHRLLAAGKQDIFKYITDCRELGATQLDPWDEHLAPLKESEEAWRANADPEDVQLSPQDEAYLDRVNRAATEAGLPFGCIAVDGAHIYEPAPEARRANRAAAYGWLEVAAGLGARQVRIDAGGPEEMPNDVFGIIVEGYRDLVARGRERGIEILIENHWGPSPVPENAVKILEAVDGLGLLFDTINWAPGMQEKGWRMCARYARATHVKTFSFDQDGNEPSVDVAKAMRTLMDAGYDGPWGIESCPHDGDEYEGVRKTIALIRRVVAENER
ncbi:MAG: sugar phosphate isomerase/epimerase [Anaerolineae bacterium]|nr:MAG: sugar phosphate isomerase/epimerase [Anaerolineae bacterium]